MAGAHPCRGPRAQLPGHAGVQRRRRLVQRARGALRRRQPVLRAHRDARWAHAAGLQAQRSGLYAVAAKPCGGGRGARPAPGLAAPGDRPARRGAVRAARARRRPCGRARGAGAAAEPARRKPLCAKTVDRSAHRLDAACRRARAEAAGAGVERLLAGRDRGEVSAAKRAAADEAARRLAQGAAGAAADTAGKRRLEPEVAGGRVSAQQLHAAHARCRPTASQRRRR